MTYAIIVRDGVLNRLDAGKIGGIKHVLATRPGLRGLAEHLGESVDNGINCGNHWQAKGAAFRFKRPAHIGVDHRIEYQSGVLGYFGHDPGQMAFGTNHRPEMLDGLNRVELRKRGLRDSFERLSGRVRDKVEMKAVHAGRQAVDNIGDRATPKTCTYPSPQFNPMPPDSVHRSFNSSRIPSTACGLQGQLVRLAGLWRATDHGQCWQFAVQRINPANLGTNNNYNPL